MTETKEVIIPEVGYKYSTVVLHPAKDEIRFSKARFVSCMIMAKTDAKELSEATGHDVQKLMDDPKGLPRNVAQKCCDVMHCDVDYLFMQNNDPRVGEVNVGKEVHEVAINRPHRGRSRRDEMESNKIMKARVEALIKDSGLTNATIMSLLGYMPGKSVNDIISRPEIKEGITERLAWILGTSTDYLTGKSKDKKSNLTSSNVPENHDKIVDGTKINKDKLIKHPCGLSRDLINWICNGYHRLPANLVTKIAKAIGVQWYSLLNASADAKAPNKEEPIIKGRSIGQMVTLMNVINETPSIRKKIASFIDGYRKRRLNSDDITAIYSGLSSMLPYTRSHYYQKSYIGSVLGCVGVKLHYLTPNCNRAVVTVDNAHIAEMYFKDLAEYERKDRLKGIEDAKILDGESVEVEVIPENTEAANTEDVQETKHRRVSFSDALRTIDFNKVVDDIHNAKYMESQQAESEQLADAEQIQVEDSAPKLEVPVVREESMNDMTKRCMDYIDSLDTEYLERLQKYIAATIEMKQLRNF